MEDHFKWIGIITLTFLSASAQAGEGVWAGRVVEDSSFSSPLEFTETIHIKRKDGNFGFYEEAYRSGYRLTEENGVLKDQETGLELGTVTGTDVQFSVKSTFWGKQGIVVICTDSFVITFTQNTSHYLRNYTCDDGYYDRVHGTLAQLEGQ